VAVVRLRGLASSVKRLADGRTRTYWYSWRGGPRLEGKPGSPEFIASFNAAVEGRRTPVGDTLTGLVGLYRASPEWRGLADSTRKHWARWLDRIAETDGEHAIGSLTPRLLDDRRVRADLLDWRNQWAHSPRQADYAMQVLRRTLSHGVDRGLLAFNHAENVRELYTNDRADRVWAPAQIEAYVAAAGSAEVAAIVPLACLTGLRRGDLARLAWKHVGAIAIVMATAKSKGRRNARVPILPETRILLDAIKAQQDARWAQLAAVATKKRRAEPPRALTVLTNTLGRPWTANGLEHQVIDAKAAIADAPTLHDARGTFVTRLRKAGLKASEIADVVGWEEERVERLLATYVDQDEIIMGIARRLQATPARD
jgi:integrase